jgi:hypothetical protein
MPSAFARVWDPFAGSGVTAQVAEKLGRRWVINERSLTLSARCGITLLSTPLTQNLLRPARCIGFLDLSGRMALLHTAGHSSNEDQESPRPSLLLVTALLGRQSTQTPKNKADSTAERSNRNPN